VNRCGPAVTEEKIMAHTRKRARKRFVKKARTTDEVEKVFTPTIRTRDEWIQRSIENGGHGFNVREAKPYYTARRTASDPEGISDAERWRLGDEFIAEHKSDKNEEAFKIPPRPDSSDPDRMTDSERFYATQDTLPGDAETEYARQMTMRFGPRPA
jgi:hypothetical protein